MKTKLLKKIRAKYLISYDRTHGDFIVANIYIPKVKSEELCSEIVKYCIYNIFNTSVSNNIIKKHEHIVAVRIQKRRVRKWGVDTTKLKWKIK